VGPCPELPISWSRRTQRELGATSPEELIAAAHASCFCMAFSGELAKLGHPAERIGAAASVAFETGPSRRRRHHLHRSGGPARVPGMEDGAAFQGAAEAARVGCPVSKALAGLRSGCGPRLETR